MEISKELLVSVEVIKELGSDKKQDIKQETETIDLISKYIKIN